MKKYFFLLIAFFIVIVAKAQIKIQSDSINLDIKAENFRKKRGTDDFYEFIYKNNEIVNPHGNKAKIAKKTAIAATPAMSPMSLSQIPYNYTIDKTKGVGEITIRSSVVNGITTNKVPIEVYASTGLTPEMSLSYNSLAESSEVGYGWSLGGTSFITPTHSNYYYDGANYKPIKLDKTTAFTLDGMRLIKISETTTQITYQTEQGNVKVVSYIPSGKYYFNVYYPDGRVGTFGYATNTSSFKVFYPLTKLVDIQGGFIDYTYTEENNTYYLTGVSYGKGSVKTGSVTFTYKTITDNRVAYTAGKLLKNTRLLSEVKSYFQSTLLRTYILTHETNQYNFLTKISCKAGSQELNPLLFYYGSDYSSGSSYFQTDMAFLESYFANSKAPDLVLNKGKFNGQITSDGLVAYPKFEVFGVSGYDKKGNCTYESRYSPDQNLLIFRNLGNYFCTPQKIQTGRGFQGLYPVDYNGDGDDELVRVNYWLENSSQANLNITTYDKNMTARSATFLLEGTFGEGGRNSAVPRTFLTGNFLGNGKTQLIALSSYKMPRRQNGNEGETRSWSRTTMIDLDGRYKTYDATPFKFDYFKDVVFAIDYDGDGRTDICLVNESGTYIYSYQDSSFKQIAYYSSLRRNDITGSNNKELLVGDINGDGLVDFLLSPKKNDYYTEWVEYPCGSCEGCRGGGGLIPYPIEQHPIMRNAQINTSQVNHNHEYENHVELRKDTSNILSFAFLPPILSRCYNPYREAVRRYNSTHTTWTVLLNTGTTFASSTFSFLSNSYGNIKFILQDINGDQLSDLVVKDYTTIRAYLNNNGSINTTAETAKLTVESDSHFITGGIGNGLYGNGRPSHILSIKDAIVTPITFSRNDARERMMTGVINSLGVVTHYNYSNLTSGSNYWTIAANTVSYPYKKLYIDMNVVGSTYTYANNQNVDSKTYYYNDAVVHTQGGGFKGFSKVTTYDNIRNIKVEETFNPTSMGIPLTYVSPTISETYYHSVTISSNKTAKILQTGKTTTDILNGNVITVSNSYDTYGSLLSETINYGNGISVVTKNVVANFTNTPYLLGELKEQSVERTRGGEKNITKMVYTYNDKHIVNNKKSYYGGNLVSEEAFTYDTNGYLSESKSKAFSSSVWLINKYTNDAYGRVTRETTPIGTFTDKVYNARGEIASTKDLKGLETKYTYDVWGRTISKTMPDGTQSSESMAWLNEGGLYQVVKTETGKPISKSNYDLLGREVRTIQVRFDGKESKIDKQYDNRGRVTQESQVYKGNSPTHWNTYTYDNFDRILTYTASTGNKIANTYAKNSVTSVVDGVSTTTTFNSLGEKISITDPAGTITHVYRADGEIASTTTLGLKISFEYDGYGRLIASTHPSSGRLTKTYDVYGNVNKETDARGKSVTKLFDEFGRLKEFTADGVKSTYTFNSNGTLASVSESSGISKSYTYHSTYWDRIEKEKETIQDGKWIEKAYTYVNGQISSIAYKSSESSNTNIAVENYLYAYGHLKEIKIGTKSVWRIDAENDLGLTTQVTTGALTRTYGFTEHGLPTSRVTKKGSTVVQNFSYSFDVNKGNLAWRKDNTRNLQENFGYDNLNRLTSYGGKTIRYDSHGNILEITSLGQFGYNATKPHILDYFKPIGTSQIPLRYQEIAYNSLMRVSSIKENNYSSSFSYNNTGSRTKMYRQKDNKEELTRYYLDEGRYEIDRGPAGVKEKLYIGADVNAAAVVLIKEGTGTWNIHYICRDYLGSITHITDESGNIKQELSYDVWGRLRNPVNHVVYESGKEPKLLLDRGYTGHEHLAEYGLINMNARLYDPVLCRFLSSDPYIQNPDLSQNYNGFAYALNNPLRYTDPSGQFFFIPILIAAGIGAAIAGVVYTITVALSPGGFSNWNFGDFIKSVAIGAVAGAVGGVFGVIAPAFSVTSSSFMANLPVYLGKAGWAAMAGVAAAGSGMFVGDLLDDGKINTSGSKYLKGMSIAGLTSGLMSFASSVYDYATWDRFSVDEKLAKLQQKYNVKFELDPRGGANPAGRYNPVTRQSFLNEAALNSKSMAYSVAGHEATHVTDHLNYDKMGIGHTFRGDNHLVFQHTERNAFNAQFASFGSDRINYNNFKYIISVAKSYNLYNLQYPKPNLLMVLRNIY